MLTELACLAFGIFPGWLLRRNPAARGLVSRATMLTIYAMLLVLGLKLGSDEILFQSLNQIGLQALCIGLCCTLGSVYGVAPAHRLLGLSAPSRRVAPTDIAHDSERREPRLRQGLWGSLVILSFFGLGLLLGHAEVLPDWLYTGDASLYVLRAMLLCVGLGMGLDLAAFAVVRNLGLRVFLVPLLSLIGCWVGAICAWALLAELSLRAALAVGSGFSYYSLSSVLVSEMGGPALGSISLLANVFRELFTLLATPLLVRFPGPLGPVASAGAAGVDTCLPVIIHFCGERFGVLALFNGLVFTMLVPFLIPLTLQAFL